MPSKTSNQPGLDIGDTSLLYGGRTLKIEVLINTDEPVEHVVARIQPAARGPKKCMALIGGGEVDTNTAKRAWAAMLPHLKQAAKRGGTG